jgi:hypothetical protein
MKQLRRLGKIAAWAVAGGTYVWFTAVRNADLVKARKAARRREQAARRTR